MSPIAIQSLHDSSGRAVKGSGRRMNGVGRRPSILELIETTGSIESLAEMRATIEEAVRVGEIRPSEKVLLSWRDAIWVCVFELMALRPDLAPYIFNVVLRWPKPDGLTEALRVQVELVTASVSSPAKRAGVAGVLV